MISELLMSADLADIHSELSVINVTCNSLYFDLTQRIKFFMLFWGGVRGGGAPRICVRICRLWRHALFVYIDCLTTVCVSACNGSYLLCVGRI